MGLGLPVRAPSRYCQERRALVQPGRGRRGRGEQGGAVGAAAGSPEAVSAFYGLVRRGDRRGAAQGGRWAVLRAEVLEEVGLFALELLHEGVLLMSHVVVVVFARSIRWYRRRDAGGGGVTTCSCSAIWS